MTGKPKKYNKHFAARIEDFYTYLVAFLCKHATTPNSLQQTP
jgi:hypothetical protein